MIVPNKAVSFEKSLLSKLPQILQALSNGSLQVTDLYRRMKGDFSDVNQFILALDMLFILGKVELTVEELKYVD